MNLTTEQLTALKRNADALFAACTPSTQFMRCMNTNLHIIAGEDIHCPYDFYKGATPEMENFLNQLGYQTTPFGISVFK